MLLLPKLFCIAHSATNHINTIETGWKQTETRTYLQLIYYLPVQILIRVERVSSGSTGGPIIINRNQLDN